MSEGSVSARAASIQPLGNEQGVSVYIWKTFEMASLGSDTEVNRPEP